MENAPMAKAVPEAPDVTSLTLTKKLPGNVPTNIKLDVDVDNNRVLLPREAFLANPEYFYLREESFMRECVVAAFSKWLYHLPARGLCQHRPHSFGFRQDKACYGAVEEDGHRSRGIPAGRAHSRGRSIQEPLPYVGRRSPFMHPHLVYCGVSVRDTEQDAACRPRCGAACRGGHGRRGLPYSRLYDKPVR